MVTYLGILFVQGAELAANLIIIQSHVDGQLFARAQVGVVIFRPDAWIRTTTLQRWMAIS